MKTIKEWFETIPDSKIRQKALNNLGKSFDPSEKESLREAFYYAFAWEFSPEGHDYWQKIADNER